MAGVTDAVNVVVGGAAGMGRAVAEAVVDRGRLLIADRDAGAARSTAAALGGDAGAIVCDVTDPTQVDALAASLDRLGALVITAGLSPQMAAGETIWAVNLAGSARVLQAFERVIVAGSVAVCFASIAGHVDPPPPEILAVLDDPLADDLPGRLRSVGIDAADPDIVYALSKHGVIRMVRRLAPVWGARGARILSVSPGVIDNPMGRLAVDALPRVETSMATWPIARLGRSDEVAAVVAFLCSDGASYMTGSDVLVDGGSARRLG